MPQAIMLQDHETLGGRGTVVDVSKGYLRNYLIPRKLAAPATKGAIVTFTKALAEEGIRQGVRVNAVAPGPVWTPLIVSTMPAEQYTAFAGQGPMGRPAQPAELAPSYVFLASQDSTYINGEIIGVTGGSPIT